MTEITSGIRAVLSNASVYDALQRAVGADRARRTLVRDHLGASSGCRILDIGCGTGELLRYLPDGVDYVGFDPSEAYIAAARARFGLRGAFLCESVSEVNVSRLSAFDLVVATGVLHHLTDEDASLTFRVGAVALAPTGRMVTVDPCWMAGQNPLARFVIARDRGQNVRFANGYSTLAQSCFSRVDTCTRTDLLRIPYAHAIVSCSGPLPRPAA